MPNSRMSILRADAGLRFKKLPIVIRRGWDLEKSCCRTEISTRIADEASGHARRHAQSHRCGRLAESLRRTAATKSRSIISLFKSC